MPHSVPEGWAARTGWDFWADYDAGTWEPESREAIQAHIRPGSTYIDIGAWLGPTVLWAAPIAGRVVAIEPDPVAFEHLKINTADLSNVELVHGAIAPETGPTFICPHDEGFGSSMTRLLGASLPEPVWKAGEAVEVPGWTLPDFFDQYNLTDVSLVKLDIEGGEADILDVLAPFLAQRRIPLLFSLHTKWLNRPIDRSWFDGFSTVEGDWSGTNTTPLLALP